jgi:MOSC domain-containing protein YiiM
MMQVLSVNVGQPREVQWRGETIRTSIWKDPVAGRVRVTKQNVAGDRQSDPSVHGAPDMTVYAYPSEHYAFWREELPGMELPWGAFGENLSVQGLFENTVRIGDRLRIGSTELVVTQPRLPCFKLGIRFGRKDIVKRFQQSGRTGFYLSVLREGELGAGDAIEHLQGSEESLTVSDIVSLVDGAANPDLMRRAAALQALPASWRQHFQKTLKENRGQSPI